MMASLSSAESTSLLDPSPGSPFFVESSPSLSAIVIFGQRSVESTWIHTDTEERLLAFSARLPYK